MFKKGPSTVKPLKGLKASIKKKLESQHESLLSDTKKDIKGIDTKTPTFIKNSYPQNRLLGRDNGSDADPGI